MDSSVIWLFGYIFSLKPRKIGACKDITKEKYLVIAPSNPVKYDIGAVFAQNLQNFCTKYLTIKNFSVILTPSIKRLDEFNLKESKMMFEAIKEALVRSRVYVNVVSVSRSGMSRKVKFYIAIDSRIVDVTHHLRVMHDSNTLNTAELDKILENTEWNNKPIVLKGCGMDLIGYYLFSITKNFESEESKNAGWYYGYI